MNNLPRSVTIIEVGPRDGLQNEKGFVPTERKVAFILALKRAGFREMEVTSFVSPKWVPQMKDAGEVVEAVISEGDPVRNLILVPNRKGVERFRKTKAKAAAFFVGVSDTFNQKNTNRTTEESLHELAPLIKDLKAEGCFIRVCLSTAFYCPFEGRVPEEKTVRLAEAFAALGADELSVADTIGMASPDESYSLFKKLKERFPDLLLTAHFHDTRKMGLANILAALQAGIDRFDASAGGLGGCPFAPGASGNVATEDVVYMLERMGIRTNIDREKLAEAVDGIAPFLSRPVESADYRLRRGG